MWRIAASIPDRIPNGVSFFFQKMLIARLLCGRSIFKPEAIVKSRGIYYLNIKEYTVESAKNTVSL